MNAFAAKFKTAQTALQFALAGRARLTVVSLKTGTRFTFRIAQKDETTPHFVSVLSGSNNECDYTFIGTIFEGRTYRHGRRSTILEGAPSEKAFQWVWNHLMSGEIPTTCEVYHEGRCGRCGRALTVPSSIETGLGPVCEGREAF